MNRLHTKNEKLFLIIKKGQFNESNCFEWTGPCDIGGYGVTTYETPRKTWKLHRLIWFLLNGEIPENMLVCHSCDNPKCFNINHLFLGTPKDNSVDRENKGRSKPKRGVDNKNSKLTEIDVLLIRKMYSEGKRICELVKFFDLNQPTVSKIVHRKRWKHI